jgi:hypothetical protein
VLASVVEAARCAIDVQRGMATRDADHPEASRVELRIEVKSRRRHRRWRRHLR